jgi:hypothetical protein
MWSLVWRSGVAVTCVTVRHQCINLRHREEGVRGDYTLAAVRQVTAAVNEIRRTR